MSRCLVTGHRGYIGSNLFKQLQKDGHEVVGIDLQDGHDILDVLKPGTDGEFHPHWTRFKPEYIFHLAAIPRVGYSIEHPVEVINNNLLSSLYILEFARKVGAKRVIYSSSSSVEGNGEGPTNPYGASKLMPESLCRVYAELYKIDAVCLRYFNVYSLDQKADGPYATAVANFMEHIRRGKEPFITGTGEQRRDMAHVSDVVAANIFCMEYGGKLLGKHLDVGTGNNISLNEIKNIVHKYFPKVSFKYIEERKGDVFLTKANIDHIMELGWSPKTKIIDGIEECFRELRGNNNG